jgi:hypothetical protein
MSKASPKTPAKSDPHPFTMHLMNTGRQWLEKHAAALQEQAPKLKPGKKAEVQHLSHVELYQSEVFRYATRLEDVPEQLRVVANFLSHRPKGRAFGRLGISRAEYVAYHYRSFVVLLQTATDVAIRLAGITLSLGIAPRDMSGRTVVENEWAVRFRLKAPLERLQAVTSPLKQTRNQWVHAGEAPLLEHTQDLSLIEKAQSLSGEEFWASDRELDAFYDMACDDLAAQISETAMALRGAIDVLLTALRPPFDYWVTRLETDWRPTTPQKST